MSKIKAVVCNGVRYEVANRKKDIAKAQEEAFNKASYIVNDVGRLGQQIAVQEYYPDICEIRELNRNDKNIIELYASYEGGKPYLYKTLLNVSEVEWYQW